MFVYWDFHAESFFLCPIPFLWGRFFYLPPLLSCFITVHCLFFNFAGQFSFGCFSLAQEMSSVIHYLPCFGEWIIACLLSVFTAFPVFIY
jgi:hypothetical protein